TLEISWLITCQSLYFAFFFFYCHVAHRVLPSFPTRRSSDLSADAFLFTSLRDSYGMQVLEAMGHGLPILTLDHQGVGTFVPPDAGIKVPVTNPHETVTGIVSAIRELALHPQIRRSLGDAGRAFAETQTWERRAERMSKLYEEVLSAREPFDRAERLWALDRHLPAGTG